MIERFTGLRAIREALPREPHIAEIQADQKQAAIDDLKKCLSGDSSSKRWQFLKMELTNKEFELLMIKRRFTGRTPDMESWADPLP